jgi:hypothetical protein
MDMITQLQTRSRLGKLLYDLENYEWMENVVYTWNHDPRPAEQYVHPDQIKEKKR